MRGKETSTQGTTVADLRPVIVGAVGVIGVVDVGVGGLFRSQEREAERAVDRFVRYRG